MGSLDKWRATGIYGFSELRNRHLTWSLLCRLRDHRELPWIVGGDFNEILCNDEKAGGLPRQPAQVEMFRTALDSCGLMDLGFEGQPFTWTNNRVDPYTVRCRLDRCCANIAWMARFPNARVHHLQYSGSDHIPIKLELNVSTRVHCNGKKRPFRFDATWFRREDCEQIVEQQWSKKEGAAEPIATLIQKHKDCRLALIKWSRTTLKQPRKRIEEIHSRINQLRSFVQTDQIREEVRVLRAELEHAYEDEDLYWRQRSRIQWIKEGDRNTKFFHSKATTRNKINRVDKLQNSAGEWVEDERGIENIISEYFNHIFTSTNPPEEEIDEVLASVEARITREASQMLSLPFSSTEVTRAISQMAPLKSPGPDGLPVAFFTKYWNVLGSDVISCVLEFLNHKKLPVELNATFIVLIPKIKNPEKITDYRPISLCNVIYKIGSKMLANRLKVVLPDLISSTQSAFVPNRLISDNVLVAFEINHYIKMNTNTRTNYMAVKLDISKAYDRIEWLFLRKILARFGIPRDFIDVIMMCVTTVSFSFLFNGMQFGEVVPSRGLRQGDPLSPYLFICCAEALTTMIMRATQRGEFGGVRIATSAPMVSCLCFADDTLVFGKASEENAQVLKRILDKYARVSGQEINHAKTTMVFSPGTTSERKENIHRILGFRIVDRHETYLGMPAAVGRTKKEIFAYLRDRIWSKMKGWGEKQLSRAGKEVMVKAVLQAIPSFVMSCFLLPQWIIKDVEAAIRRYWWGHGSNRGMAWLTWPEMCKSKEKGGLGFRDLKAFNLALITTQAWRIFTSPDLLLSKIMKARYFPSGNIFAAELGSRPSLPWRSIWKTLPYLRMGLQRRLGDGTETSIWADPWFKDGGSRRVLTKRPMATAFPDKVSDIIDADTRSWRMDFLQEYLWPVDIERILAIPLGRGLTSDRWVWHCSKDGKFSVKTCYHMILSYQAEMETRRQGSEGESSGVSAYNWKTIWDIPLTPKINSFLWRMCHNILPTNGELYRRKIAQSAICSRCTRAEESILHVILHCHGMERVWKTRPFSELQQANISSPWDWVCATQRLLKHEDFLTAMVLTWKSWERRNQMIKGESVLKETEMISWCRDYVLTFKTAYLRPRAVDTCMHPSVWIPPAVGRLKVNYDAALPQHNRELKVAAVARDPTGRCVGWRVKHVRGSFLLVEGEALAALEAISFAREKGWSNVEFEGDCLQIVKSLQAGGCESASFGPIVLDCRLLVANFNFVSFQFIKRSGNLLAHALAKLPCNNVLEGFHLPPNLASIA